MKLLKKYETPFEGILNNWLNDEFIGIPSIDHSIKTLPPVNLIESKESFTIELSAPGFDKDDFKIELDNFNLSVSLDIDNKMNESIQYIKREYNYSSFKRSFKLAKYSDIKKIDASYVNGILTIQIPKTKEAIPLPVKSIKIS
jgi:HSP20 family protein